MITKPPLYDFRPFTTSRVAEVRQARELAWSVALAPKPTKKRAVSTKLARAPKTPTLPPGVPPELQAMMLVALSNLKL